MLPELKRGRDDMTTDIFGVVSPHPPIFVPDVGGDEAQEARSSLCALETARRALEAFAPDTIVLISPHAPLAADAFLVDDSASLSGSLGQFGAERTYSWPGDRELAATLIHLLEEAGVAVLPRSTSARLKPGWLDHGTVVPLSFLQPAQSCSLVVLSLSYLPYASHRQLGELVRSAAEKLGRRTAFVASGDMSHRLSRGAAAGYTPRGAELDAKIRRLVEAGCLSGLMSLDPDLVEEGGECGLRSIIALGGYCGPDPVPTRVLSYEGPWGVGYLTALAGQAAIDLAVPPAGRKGGTPGRDESEIVALARSAVETYVTTGRILAPQPLPARYPERAGAFVSLHRKNSLRGCIGTIGPTRSSLAEEIVANAIDAATRDPRFAPVDAAELADLDITVDVLQPPESCTIADLDPATYGVIVTSGQRRGLLLPDLEGVEDVASQVSIAMSKAGIRPGSGCDIERFKVDRYT